MEFHTFPWIFALIVFVYLLVKQRRVRTALEGLAGNLIGFYMVLVGAQMTDYTLAPMSALTQSIFGVRGGIMNSEVFAAELLTRYAFPGFFVLFLAFAVNLLLSRITRFRGMYLTGHHFLYLSLLAVCILRGFTSLPWPWIVALGALLLGVWTHASVSITTRFLRRVTGTENTGMANSCSATALLGAGIGRIAGGPDAYDSEPAGEGTDTSTIPVLAAFGALCVYLALSAAAGPERSGQFFATDEGWILNCLIAALLYGAQVALLINGIRLLLSNTIRMFWDLAKRFSPDFWIGLDSTALIGYSPRAWYAGFFFSVIGATLSAGALLALHAEFVPLPSLTSCFFAGGAAGVCGNAFGGKRGARVTGLVTGVASAALVCAIMPMFGPLAERGVSFGETEYGLFSLFLRLICGLFH